jgi:hypothetical protein
MGEASDQLKDQVKDQAREVGEQAMERGKEVAAAATSAVKEEADRQGLTLEKMAQSVKAGSGGNESKSTTGGKPQQQSMASGSQHKPQQQPSASGSQQKSHDSAGSSSHGLGTSATANPGSTVSGQGGSCPTP